MIPKRDPCTQILRNVILEHRLGEHKNGGITRGAQALATEDDVLANYFCGEQSLNPIALMPTSPT